MNVIGYILLAAGVLGVIFTRVPALNNLVPQIATVPTAVYAATAVVGLIVVIMTRRPRD